MPALSATAGLDVAGSVEDVEAAQVRPHDQVLPCNQLLTLRKGHARSKVHRVHETGQSRNECGEYETAAILAVESGK